MFDYFFVVTMLLGSKSYTTGKPVYFLFFLFVKKMLLLDEQESCACGWGPYKMWQIFSVIAMHLILLLTVV